MDLPSLFPPGMLRPRGAGSRFVPLGGRSCSQEKLDWDIQNQELKIKI